MNFFRIFNVIYKLFSKRGRKALIITLFIIIGIFLFSYNQAFAYDDYTINFSAMNHNLVVTLDNSNGDFDNYKYCIISSDGSNYQFLLSTSTFYIDNSGVNTASYIGFRNTDNSNILVSAGFGSDTSSYTYQFSNLGGANRPSLYNNIVYSNSVVYTDNTLTQASSSVNVLSSIYSNDGSSSSGGDSGDYTDVLNHIDEQVTSTNTTIDNIDNNVYEIKVILQGQNTNDVVNAVSSSSATTQNIITNTSSTTQAMIQNQTSQSQTQFNTLISNTYDDSDVVLPSDNNTDITSNGFDAIFTAIYNAMTANTYSVIEIPIPYCNESIYIDPNAIRQAFDNTIVTNLIGAFYYFLVGLFIYKDIAKIIQKIKDGSIATSSDTNIKTTML